MCPCCVADQLRVCRPHPRLQIEPPLLSEGHSRALPRRFDSRSLFNQWLFWTALLRSRVRRVDYEHEDEEDEEREHEE